MRSSAGAHPATTMAPVVMTAPMTLTMGAHNGTRRRSHGRAATASDCTANNRTSNGATSC